ncbi:hypothetical protein N9N67_07365 [Bacteriovoracaceae bacterium]|nr:hypothetical protein [Bacteriovoracaceae bacterium]
MKFILAFSFFTFLFFGSSIEEKRFSSTKFRKIIRSIKATAATNLDPSSLDMSVASGRTDFVRFLYFLVNGPSSEYTISGPEDGYVGLINELTGVDALGGGLQSGGIETCSDIPLSGSVTMSDSDGTYIMSFSAGDKTIPSHFGSDASETYDKKVSVSLDGTDFMAAQFKCSAASSTVTGYIRMDISDENLAFETYYQQNESTDAVYVDFFSSKSTGDSEKMGVRFETSDGDTFKLWLVRSVTSNGNVALIAVTGNKTLGLSKLNMLLDDTTNGPSNSTDITSISTGTSGTQSTFVECLDMSTNSTSSSCTSNGISITSPGTWNLGSGANDFNLQDVAALSLTSI